MKLIQSNLDFIFGIKSGKMILPGENTLTLEDFNDNDVQLMIKQGKFVTIEESKGLVVEKMKEVPKTESKVKSVDIPAEKVEEGF